MRPTERGVYAKEVSAGRKVGAVAVTYVAQGSCPDTCPFLHAGCYAENGFVGGFITKRLNRATTGLTPLELARNEADAIDELIGDRDLRLHIVGDSTSEDGTRLIAAAAGRYMDRGGRRVWTYTHAWRTVPREAWGRVSVLASCESPVDVMEARSRGYATALTVMGHPGAKRYDVGPLSILPCPEQTTEGVTCATCRLCTDDDRLRDSGMTVAFAVHGNVAAAAASLKGARRMAAVSA